MRTGEWLRAVEASVRARLSRGSSDRTQDDRRRIRFDECLVPHLDAVHRFARSLLRTEDAADLVQETYLAAWRGIDGMRDGQARAWLFAILRNQWRNRLRRDGHDLAVLAAQFDAEEALDVVDATADAETALIVEGESAAIRAVLDALPWPAREILCLREIEDMSYRQIAEVLGVPLGTVMSRLARARLAFARAWTERNLAGGPR